MVDAVPGKGYKAKRSDRTIYLDNESPVPDDMAFTERLAAKDVFVFPGIMFETPGFFRISLTANEDMIERSLPIFRTAIEEAQSSG